jgi:hypothetical protein
MDPLLQAAAEETLSAAGTAIATAMGTGGNDYNEGGGRRVTGRQVWGRHQAAEGGRNGNTTEMGRVWVL